MEGGIIDLPALMGTFTHKVYFPSFMAGSWRNIDFAANNGLDPFFSGRLVEFDGSKQIPVIGHGNGVHAGFPDLFHEWRDLVCAIEKTILCVNMEMDKSVNGRHLQLLRHISI
jgi:hypothetical protein